MSLTADEQAYMLAIDELESVRAKILKPEIGTKYSEQCELESKAKILETLIADLEERMWTESLGPDEISNVLCPTCASENVIHSACGDYKYACTCSSSETDFYCGWCNQSFDAETVVIPEHWHDVKLEQLTLDQVKATKSVVKSCSHAQQEVKLPNGTIVYCTALRSANQIEGPPDFGLYADSGWVTTATWRNEMINWPDMSLPRNPDMALDQIEDAYQRACHDERVDLGCIGAHGRTGTILAIMVLMATDGSMTGREAIKWVWDNYCSHAIETKRQEWFIEWAAGQLFEHDVPEEPTQVSNTSCGATEHLAMKSVGLTACVKKDCKWWDKDMEELEQRGTISGVGIDTLMKNSSYEQYCKEYNIA